MSGGGFTESVVEEAALDWLAGLGWRVAHGPEIAPGMPEAERESYHDVILVERLRAAVERLNPGASQMARAQALDVALTAGAPDLMVANRGFHGLLVNGVEVETLVAGEARGERLQSIDFERPANNDWLAVNQFTVVEGQHERRPDVVLFVNGLPLVVIEFKNAADPKATIETAFKQLVTYQNQIPRLFRTNELLMISDGLLTQVGCLRTPKERFAYWKTVDGDLDPSGKMETALRGVFDHRRFLDLLRGFIVFEDDGATVVKKVAQYHQFHAVRKAHKTALRAAGANGDGKGGVLWHTQGSGKSLTMLFFAGALIREPALANPTIVMLTDRADLDDQLFGTFTHGKELLRQTPVQAESRAHLRELLTVNAGGVVFTTIQKFYPDAGQEDHPLLTNRRNVVVMADEAHRSQYNFGTRINDAGHFARGFAQHLRDALPNATFVAFTGTPLKLDDRDTTVVFGDYIDIYDVGRAIADGATVPIYFESRQNRVGLPEGARTMLDAGFEELTEEAEETERQRLGSRWSQIEAVVGARPRLAQIAADLIPHAERRTEALPGKLMIVAMSRRICVDLYEELAKLRPEWAAEADEAGAMKIVMTGAASDPEHWQPHIRNKERRERLAERFKDPDDPFRIVIVRDMWLTGFDAPCLHTMYIDKPMKGHGLMQAIARVNRVFGRKPGGLVVDYIGLANNLKAALRAYVLPDGGQDRPVENEELDLDGLVTEMINRLEACRLAFRGFDYGLFLTGTPTERVRLIPEAENFLIQRDYRERKEQVLDRFLKDAAALKKAFALASSTDAAQAIRQEYAFFQVVRAALIKTTGRGGGERDEDIEQAIRQLLDQAIAPEGVVDIFAAAGLDKPNISVLSDAFLAEIKGMPQRNLAAELLKKLLNDEIGAARKTSVVQARRFSEKLEESLARYHNRAIETAQIIEAMIELAKEMRAAAARGEALGLTDDEVAFYDALADNASAAEVLGDEQLRVIAREVADAVRNNTTIDWQYREQARAKLRAHVKRVLRRHGYPPDQAEAATLLVLEQAELFASEETAPVRYG